MTFLIVRLGALGDVLHAVPAAAALRAAHPDARIHWLVERRHRPIVDLVTVVDGVIELAGRSPAAWMAAIARLRRIGSDVAFDFQGLLKSAVFARASGAAVVAGFAVGQLRERAARAFYTTTVDVAGEPHVIRKNLRLLRAAGVTASAIAFPLAAPPSAALDAVRSAIGEATPFALINPGAAWPNKRWPAERYGAVAARLRAAHGLASVVLWGPGEETLARTVAAGSGGAAHVAPRTTLADLLALARAASLVVSGDTGPLHIAAAAGTPAVALFGPTDPERNGPWSAADRTVSRYDACACHYKRRCLQPSAWCLATIDVEEVARLADERLARAAEGPVS